MGATAIVTGVVSIGTASINSAKLFQASMKRVQGVMRATEAQMAQLEAKARDAGATTSFRASEAADAIEMLAKNGLKYQDVMDGALDATLSLAAALGADLAPSADLITDLMAQFGLKAGDLTEVVDLVTGAALNSKFGFDDFRLAIGQAGGVAGKSGVEIQDFLTGLAATSSAFASGQDAGTSFKTFLMRLTPESKQAAEAMANLGLEFFDARGNMKDLASISEELREGVEGLSEQARNEALKKIFGTDAIRTALLLAEQGAEGIRDLGSAIQEVSAQEQADIRLLGLEGALKELASAWESLQLTMADAGGLDVAENAIRRLTDIIRFLNENFDEINEVVERVANALTVVLVGRGINYATARAAAMGAAYIELAQSVGTAGKSAGAAGVAMSRLGVAARALPALLGGPAGIILTAGALASLAINLDQTEDNLKDAHAASQNSVTALDLYREATKKAGDEQAKFGGKIDKATRAMLTQSRVNMQDALDDLEESYKQLNESLTGKGILRPERGEAFVDALFKAAREEFKRTGGLNVPIRLDPETSKPERLGAVFQKITDLMHGAKTDPKLFTDLSDYLKSLGGVGQETVDALADYREALASGDNGAIEEARRGLVDIAQASGEFQDILEDIANANKPEKLAEGMADLVLHLRRAAIAGDVLRGNVGDAYRALLEPLADNITQQEILNAALEGNWELASELAQQNLNPFQSITDGAKEAAGETDKVNRSLAEQYRLYGEGRQGSKAVDEYRQKTSAAKRKELVDVADGGLRSLIRLAEGTAGGRGYNTTLDYGRWTGGPRNLTGLTLNEIIALQGQMLANPENRALYGNGRGSSALGAYQITRQTLTDYLMPSLGLNGDELFDEKLQDRMADQLIRRRENQGVAGLQNEWQGLLRVPDHIIQAARVNTPLTTVDPEVTKTQQQAQEDRADALQRERDLIADLMATGSERAAQLEFEAELVGKTTEEQTRLRFIFDALNEAKRQGIDVDRQTISTGETLRQVIERQALAIAKRTAEEERGQVAQQNAEQQLGNTRSAVDSAFNKIIDAPQKIGEVFADLLDDLRRRLLQLAFDPLLEQLAQTINNIFSPSNGGGAATFISGMLGFSDGGRLPKRAGGGGFDAPRAAGRLQGFGSKTQDNLLFWGSRDEFMMRAAAVDYYGADFMEQLNKMQVPRFATGGALGGRVAPTAPAPSSSAAPLIGELKVVVDPEDGRSPEEQGAAVVEAIVNGLPGAIDERLMFHARADGIIGQKFKTKGGY
ncbi:phage tail tape measure protein [Thalassovita sp.]|uniref:phage tail tape measure protein n=1 Tax=Thalassovita sp. TaxID=1979401 RepID=UPI002AAF2FD6|nr:phage tail tape measure protein [Thalassovita sp.]